MDENIGTLLAMLAVVIGCLFFVIYALYKLKVDQAKANDRLDKIAEAIAKNRPKND